MTVCSNCQRFRETWPYRLALRNLTARLCAECHASLSAIGMTWVAATPIVERRQPAWLSRITAREIA